MKSTEVYRIINKIIFPGLKSAGFKKTKSGMLDFFKALKKHDFVCWFQCSQDGFDAYAGSKLVFEVQISKTNDIGSPSVFRERIPFFLTVDDLAKVTVLENRVKDKLSLPPNTHYIFGMDENIQRGGTKKNLRKLITSTQILVISGLYILTKQMSTIGLHSYNLS